MSGRHRRRSIRQLGPMASTVRKQTTMNPDAQLSCFSFLFSLSLQPIEWCCSHLGYIFPPQLTYSRISLTDRPQNLSLFWFFMMSTWQSVLPLEKSTWSTIISCCGRTFSSFSQQSLKYKPIELWERLLLLQPMVSEVPAAISHSTRQLWDSRYTTGFAVSAYPFGLGTFCIPNTHFPFVPVVLVYERTMRVVRGAASFIISMCAALLLTVVFALHYRSKEGFIALHSVLSLPSRRLEDLCHSVAQLDMNHRSKHCRLVALLETMRCVVWHNSTEWLSKYTVLVTKTETTSDYTYRTRLGESNDLEIKGIGHFYV